MQAQLSVPKAFLACDAIGVPPAVLQVLLHALHAPLGKSGWCVWVCVGGWVGLVQLMHVYWHGNLRHKQTLPFSEKHMRHFMM